MFLEIETLPIFRERERAWKKALLRKEFGFLEGKYLLVRKTLGKSL